ncbi:hypothetical protein V2J09_021702 [Rumex salicifolius]
MVMVTMSATFKLSSVFGHSSAIASGLTMFTFTCLLILYSSPATFVLSASDDFRSLLEFKKGIKEDPLNKVLGSWNHVTFSSESDLGACPSSFFGVSCDGSSNGVVSIVLDRLGLSGELKFYTLTGLRSLKKLSLSGNNFTGRIVPSLGSMSTLEYLDLSNNKFYGPIPSRVHDLYGLNYLNLSLNAFEGWYPSGVRNWNQLKFLDVHSNRLSGNVKTFFSELQNVEYIDLSHNLFSGGLPVTTENVSSLGNTLQYLNLRNNLLDGELPSADTLALFRSLQVLDLGDNLFTGELPSFVSLSNLKVLRVSNNKLSGAVPDELLASLVPLQELDLSINGLTGSLAGFNSSSLQHVNISYNALKGSLPSSMGGCLIVDLSWNMISGDISILKNWGSALKWLDLSSNMLNGSLPDLGKLPQAWNSFSSLTTVDLSANDIGGPIPPSLFSSANLVTLNLSGNHLSGLIPLAGPHSLELLALASYPPMEFLDLSDNMLIGKLPPEIGGINGLKLLNLANNNMSGQIPNDLGKLRSLIFLDLSGNGFEGQLPDNLPVTILDFNVSYNNLSGPVPANLRKFPPSCFHPGNERLQIPDGGQFPFPNHRDDRHHKSITIITVIVLGSIGAASMIALVLLLYYRNQLHAFHGRSKLDGETSGRAVRAGRFNQLSVFKSQGTTDPSTTNLSFSRDLLLNSNSMSLSGKTELATGTVQHVSAQGISCGSSSEKTTPRGASSGSATATSSGNEGSEQPITLDVYSPDQLVGELFFVDSCLSFTEGELSRALAEVLGRSSYGTLYKATLENDHMLTVKWLRAGLVKNKKEFAKEVKKLGSLRHPNMVPVRAYFWGPREERLVLADYIHGDNLALHLHDSSPRKYSLLTFNQRLTVGVDVARCLQFLHNHGIPHGNLKPTNILLSTIELTAHLTDFGLHRLMISPGISEQILNLGALGYCAPELARSDKPAPSFKDDVYSFGIILMELLTRRSAGDIISGQSGQVDLPDWVRLCDREGRRMDCIDRELYGVEEPSKAMDDLLVLSLKCILPANERPNIHQVCEELASISA